MTLATNLRKLRLARGLTQHALAALAGTNQRQISMIETGRRNPRAATILALTKALKCSPARLFAGTTTRRKRP